MDPRLNDPNFRAQLDTLLVSKNPVDRQSAQYLLSQNGVDISQATTEAKQRQAARSQAPQPTLRPAGAPPIPSAPAITAAQATRMVLALAGDNGSIAKFEATQYCKNHGIPFEEFRAHARNFVAEADRRRGG
jgi:hypothetical protein